MLGAPLRCCFMNAGWICALRDRRHPFAFQQGIPAPTSGLFKGKQPITSDQRALSAYKKPGSLPFSKSETVFQSHTNTLRSCYQKHESVPYVIEPMSKSRTANQKRAHASSQSETRQSNSQHSPVSKLVTNTQHPSLPS
jgi:hypothetical protein